MSKLANHIALFSSHDSAGYLVKILKAGEGFDISREERG
jgi:hypothetical protein